MTLICISLPFAVRRRFISVNGMESIFLVRRRDGNADTWWRPVQLLYAVHTLCAGWRARVNTFRKMDYHFDSTSKTGWGWWLCYLYRFAYSIRKLTKVDTRYSKSSHRTLYASGVLCDYLRRNIFLWPPAENQSASSTKEVFSGLRYILKIVCMTDGWRWLGVFSLKFGSFVNLRIQLRCEIYLTQFSAMHNDFSYKWFVSTFCVATSWRPKLGPSHTSHAHIKFNN